jgi:hypothetical protein
MIGVLLLNLVQQNLQQHRLRKTFYELLTIQNGCLTLIQLAAVAQVDAAITQRYLQRQLDLLGGYPEVDADGDLFYRFPKVHPPDTKID